MQTFRITATIPTTQYGNIQPEIVVEAETYTKAKAVAMRRLQALWDMYGERPLKKNSPVRASIKRSFEEVITFTGEKIRWYPEEHEYTDLEGSHLVSGSEYAKSFDKPFDTERLSAAVGKKYDIPAETVAEMWRANSRISTTFGSALHYAMEQWFKYKNAACGGKEYNLAKPTFLREAVNTFPLKDANIVPEVIVSNIANKMAGTIDGIEMIDSEKKIINVIDYKSDTDVEKNLPKHFRQLSYYAKILQFAGWSVGKLVVWNYTDGKWTPYESEILPVEVGSSY